MSARDPDSVRPAIGKTPTEITREWDQIAHLRHKQISSGKDLSFSYVLRPSIQALLESCNLERVLDFGCGTGGLTGELALLSATVTAVDASTLSVALAQEACDKFANISFYSGMIEEFAVEWAGAKFTTAVANMTLMTCVNLDSVIQAIAKLIVPSGCLIATITHPWFWPYYRGYSNADWFRYDREVVLEAPFQISEETTDYVTTHVHRPLAAYLNSLSQAGFMVDCVLEPYPDAEFHSLYGERWEFPRFLVFRAFRVPK